MILDRNYPRLKNLILISKSVSHLINEKDKIYPKANLIIYLFIFKTFCFLFMNKMFFFRTFSKHRDVFLYGWVQDTSPKRHKSLASEVPNYFFASQVPWKIKLKRHKTQIRRQKWLTQSVIGPKYFKYN